MSIAEIFSLGMKIIDRVLPDPQKKLEAQEKLAELAQRGELAKLQADTQLATAQIEVNKVEAASANIFVAGWRPFIGWCCGAIFACNYIGTPLLAWLSPLLGIPAPPRLEIGEVLPVLLGMLGLGTLRTVDKKFGTA